MKKLIGVLLLFASASSVFAAAPTIGTTAGYLVDSKDGYFTVSGGFEVANTGVSSQSVALEVGHTSDSESGVKLTLIPITLNYRLTSAMNPDLDLYAGAGLGATRVKLSGFGLSGSDNAFTGQLFAGLAYKLTPRVALTGSVRYLWIGDIEMFGIKDRVGDDSAVEIGLRFSL